MDPLVVYKKEAFSKFQNLLYRLKFDTTAYLTSIDWQGIKEQDQLQTRLPNAKNKSDGEYIKMLKEIAKSEEFKKALNQRQNKYAKLFEDDKAFESNKVAYSDEDGIEVFETAARSISPLVTVVIISQLSMSV